MINIIFECNYDIQTFPVARMSALANLQPQPNDYFLQISQEHINPDVNKIHSYIDYYKELLKVFPNLGDAFGALGYCYYALNDYPKAIDFFKMAIQYYPACFWNYYNLGVIYIKQSRFVYLPLFSPNLTKGFQYELQHVKTVYRALALFEQLLIHPGGEDMLQKIVKSTDLELYVI